MSLTLFIATDTVTNALLRVEPNTMFCPVFLKRKHFADPYTEATLPTSSKKKKGTVLVNFTPAVAITLKGREKQHIIFFLQ